NSAARTPRTPHQRSRQNSAQLWPDPGRTARPGTAIPARGNRARPDTSPPAPASSRLEARWGASPPANRGSPQLHETLIQPRLPVTPRRDRGIDPGPPRRAEQPRRDPLLKPLLQSGRAKMHDGAAQSRDVETLDRRGNSDGARRDLRMQRRERNMRL